MSLAEIKTAIEQLSFEERAKLAAWFHGWKDDEWDEQMKRDVAAGKLDPVLREVDDDIRAGRITDLPMPAKAIVLEAIRKLPEGSTFNEIRERIEFIAGVREGLEQIERGEVVPLAEAEKKIDKWATK